jgi:hypothetical protein
MGRAYSPAARPPPPSRPETTRQEVEMRPTCPNCGDVVLDGDYTHPECHDEYIAYLFDTKD